MAGSSVLLALNSLSSDGLVRLSAKQHEQFEALVEDYFNTSEASDDANSSRSDDEMEYGKRFWLTLHYNNRHFTDHNEIDNDDDCNFNKEGVLEESLQIQPLDLDETVIPAAEVPATTQQLLNQGHLSQAGTTETVSIASASSQVNSPSVAVKKQMEDPVVLNSLLSITLSGVPKHVY